MPKRPKPLRLLIRHWLEIYDKQKIHFSTDGLTIFCKACQKFVASSRFQLTQHIKTASHQNNIQKFNENTNTGKQTHHSEINQREQKSKNSKKKYTRTCFICCTKLPNAPEIELDLRTEDPVIPLINNAKLNLQSFVQLLTPVFIADVAIKKSANKDKKNLQSLPNKLCNNGNWVINDKSLLETLGTKLKHMDFCTNCSDKLKHFLNLFQQLKEIENDIHVIRRNVVGNIKKHYHDLRQRLRVNKLKKKYSKKQLKKQCLREEIIKGISSSSSNEIFTTSRSCRDLSSAYVKITPLKIDPTATRFLLEEESTKPLPFTNDDNNFRSDFSNGGDEFDENDYLYNDCLVVVDVKPNMDIFDVEVAGRTDTISEETDDLLGSIINPNSMELQAEYQIKDRSPKNTAKKVKSVKLKQKFKEMLKTAKDGCLKKRRNRKTVPGPAKCTQCDKIFPHYRNLRQHLNIHSRPFKCETCNLNFSWRHSYNVHIASEHPELYTKQLKQCPKCDKSYVLKSTLLVHMNAVHDSVGQFMCHLCPFQTSVDRNLQRHIDLIHLKIKKFKCEFCDAMFGRNTDKKKHLRLHTGEKPHACGICGKTFRVLQCCKNHELTHGGGELKHICHLCGKGFAIKNYLYNHLNSHLSPDQRQARRRKAKSNQDNNFRVEPVSQVTSSTPDWNNVQYSGQIF